MVMVAALLKRRLVPPNNRLVAPGMVRTMFICFLTSTWPTANMATAPKAIKVSFFAIAGGRYRCFSRCQGCSGTGRMGALRRSKIATVMPLACATRQ